MSALMTVKKREKTLFSPSLYWGVVSKASSLDCMH